MTHLRINLKTISVNLGPELVTMELGLKKLEMSLYRMVQNVLIS